MLQLTIIENGKTLEIQGYIEKVNPKDRSNESLLESNEKLKSIFNSSKEIIITIDIENNRVSDLAILQASIGL